MSESKIRDALASNLALLDGGFSFYSKEQPLPNQVGTSGFIDILAKDEYDNYVIIELKRSDQAARQAITEVCKYAELLKQNYHIQSSHIRIVIVSTEWRELLASFSDFANNSRYQVDGYELTVDECFNPVKATKVSPLAEPQASRMIREHLEFCYRSLITRSEGIAAIRQRMSELDIHNYVIIEMEPYHIKEMNIYPYCAYIAIRQEPPEWFRTRYFNSELEIDGYPEDDMLDMMTSELLAQVTNGIECGELGTGNSAALLGMLNSGRWKITHVSGCGFFSNSLTYNEDGLIHLLTGKTGNSDIHFHDFGSSKSRARLEWVFSQLRRLLFDQPEWAEAIEVIAKELLESGLAFEFTIDVYNPPESLLKTLHKVLSYNMYGYDTPFVFMPYFSIDVVYFEPAQTHIVYFGSIKWNGLQVDSDNFYRQVLKGKESRIQVIADLYPRFEEKVIRELNLFYGVDRIVLDSSGIVEKEPFPAPNGGALVKQDFTLLDFILEKFRCVQEVDQYFAKRTYVVY